MEIKSRKWDAEVMGVKENNRQGREELRDKGRGGEEEEWKRRKRTGMSQGREIKRRR